MLIYFPSSSSSIIYLPEEMSGGLQGQTRRSARHHQVHHGVCVTISPPYFCSFFPEFLLKYTLCTSSLPLTYDIRERCRSRPNNRILGVVGRPAVSCRRHQLEHQKCPEDCPRRRTVDQHLQDRARNQKREEGYACPSSLHRSSLHPCSLVPPSDSRHDRGRTQLTEGGYACPSLLHHSPLQPCSSSASVLPFNTGPATSHGTPQNVPKHTSLSYSQLLSLDTYDIQSYHLTGKLPTEELNIGPDTYWHSARDTTPVSNSTTIVLDLHDGGPPQISLSQANFHLGMNTSLSSSPLASPPSISFSLGFSFHPLLVF